MTPLLPIFDDLTIQHGRRPSDNVVVWRWDSDPFGVAAPNENPSGAGEFKFNLRFPGQYADAETGLNYNYFRDYSPKTGRYAQSDPVGLEGGANTYAYVGSNSLSNTDPEGLWINVAVGAAVGGIGNLTYQLYKNDWNIDCVNRSDVAAWMLYGAAAGALVPEGLLTKAGMQTVSHWGPPSNWIMTGSGSIRNWLFSGSPQLKYAFNNVVTTQIPTKNVIWPVAEGSGLFHKAAAVAKGLLGQRMIVGAPL